VFVSAGGRNPCFVACNLTVPTAYPYTQTAYSATINKYFNTTNCSNGTCDWNTYTHEQWDGDCYSLDATCGNGTFVSACAYSDVRLKTGIETLKDSLIRILEIETVEYDWNEKNWGSREEYEYFSKMGKLHQIGLIAQNVRVHFPEAVGIGPDGYYFIDYKKLNSVVVEGIKEQQIFIDEITKQIDELEIKLR
jgi:hypothetical protein